METRKVKKKRFNVARTLVFVLFIYIIVCFCMYVYKEPVRHYFITGNSLVSDVEILRMLELDDYPSYVSINTSSLEKKLMEHQFIKSAKVSYGLNFKIKISVEEKIPVYIVKSSNKVVLSDGTQIDRTNEFVGLPILLNYTPEDIMKLLAEGLSQVDEGIRYMISEIEYAPTYDAKGKVIDPERFLLSMNDKNMVYISVKKGKTSNKTTVLNEYLNIISNYKITRNGTLFLDGNEGRYPFKYAQEDETTTEVTEETQNGEEHEE